MARERKYVPEYRPDNGRNFIRVGDLVKARPSSGSPFVGKVHSIEVDDHDTVICVAVSIQRTISNRSDHPQRGMGRTLFPSAISRMDQTKQGRDVVAR